LGRGAVRGEAERAGRNSDDFDDFEGCWGVCFERGLVQEFLEEGEALDWGADVAFVALAFVLDSGKVERTLKVDDDCFPVWSYGSRILTSKDISTKRHPFFTFDLHILLHESLQIRVPIPQNLSKASTPLCSPSGNSPPSDFQVGYTPCR
jgi:hypothetical protein